MKNNIEIINEQKLEINPPLRFTATYIAPCGDEYYIANCYVPRLPLRCLDCGITHYYEAVSLEYPIDEDWINEDDTAD